MIGALKAALAPGDAQGQAPITRENTRVEGLLASERAEELGPSYKTLIEGPRQMKRVQGRRYCRCVHQLQNQGKAVRALLFV